MQSSTPLKYKLVFPMRAVCVHGCMHECMYVLDVAESHVSPALVHWFVLFIVFVFSFWFLISNMILFLSFCFFCTDVGFPKSSQKFVAGEAVRCFSFISQQYAGIWHAESKDADCAPITRGDRIVNGSGDSI